MKINLISDLHCRMNPSETYPHFNFPYFAKGFEIDAIEKADVLVVAGDLAVASTYQNVCLMLKQHCDLFGMKLVAVKGNHDYYGSSYEEMSKEPLGQVVSVGGVSFVCSTGWSPVKKNTWLIRHQLYDYYAIKGFTVENTVELSKKQYDWIYQTVIEQSKIADKIVVVTHHLPSSAFISDQYRGSQINEAFAVMDYETEQMVFDIAHMPKVAAWMHGHSHDPYMAKVGNCLFVRNPIGYENERDLSDGFNKIIKI